MCCKIHRKTQRSVLITLQNLSFDNAISCTLQSVDFIKKILRHRGDSDQWSVLEKSALILQNYVLVVLICGLVYSFKCSFKVYIERENRKLTFPCGAFLQCVIEEISTLTLRNLHYPEKSLVARLKWRLSVVLLLHNFH